MAVGDLQAAAGQAFNNVGSKWLANTLKTNLAAFAAACKSTFVESNVNDHPMGNWLAIIAALATTMPTGGSVNHPVVTYLQMQQAAQSVGGMCSLAFQLNAQGLIANAQATVILNAYNANLT